MIARLLGIKIALSILFGAAMAAGALCAGCAQTHGYAKTPSTAGVRGKIEEAQQQIHAANAAVKSAGAENREIQGLSDRIDHKAVIIDRWLETHDYPK